MCKVSLNFWVSLTISVIALSRTIVPVLKLLFMAEYERTKKMSVVYLSALDKNS